TIGDHFIELADADADVLGRCRSAEASRRAALGQYRDAHTPCRGMGDEGFRHQTAPTRRASSERRASVIPRSSARCIMRRMTAVALTTTMASTESRSADLACTLLTSLSSWSNLA